MLDERFKRPALHVAEGVEEPLAPLLNYYKNHIEPIGCKSVGSTRANQYTEVDETQYQNKHALSPAKALIERITSLPSDQWQQTSFLLQRSVIQVQELSDAMLARLHALRRTISYLSTPMQRSVSATQKQLTIALVEAAKALSATITDLHATLTSEDLIDGVHIDRVADMTIPCTNPLLERVKAKDKLDAPCGSCCEDHSGWSCEDKPNPSTGAAKTTPERPSRTTSARTSRRATGLEKRSST